MKISATINSSYKSHEVLVTTDGNSKAIDLPVKAEGYGSAINGGELLLLSLATCYCNDIYREAALRGIKVHKVTVECTGGFGAAGEPGSDFNYKPMVEADADEETIADLINHVDRIAEIHKTLRQGLPVILKT